MLLDQFVVALELESRSSRGQDGLGLELLHSIQTYYLELLLSSTSSSCRLDSAQERQRRMQAQIWACLMNIHTFDFEDHQKSHRPPNEATPYFTCARVRTTFETRVVHCPLFREFPFSEQQHHEIQREIQGRILVMKKHQMLN